MNTTTNTPSTTTLDPAPLPSRPPIAVTEPLVAANDNGGLPPTDPPESIPSKSTSIATADTTPLVAHPNVVRHIRTTLRRYRVAAQDMADTIADVQVASIEAAWTGPKGMPRTLAQWKALVRTIAVHLALDRRRNAKARSKYDAGLCDDADAYMSPRLYWEARDPVDTKRYLVILKDLFDSGQMPEDGEEILQGEADHVPRAEIAAELGVTTTVAHNRLFRMRAKFRRRLAGLGMLTLLLLLLGALLAPVAEVAAPAPQTAPESPRPPMCSAPACQTTPEPLPPPACSVPAPDGGPLPPSENRPRPSEEIAPCAP